MDKIKLFGLGGQGVVTAAKILCHAAAIFEDKYARTIPAFGHERRGAPVFSDVMIDEEPILLNSFVYEPDFILIFDPSIIARGIQFNAGTHKDSVLVINTGQDGILSKLKNEYGFKHIYHVDATNIALENLGRDIPNGAMLGAFAKTGLVKIGSIDKSLKQSFKTRSEGEKNARAARQAFDKTRRI